MKPLVRACGLDPKTRAIMEKYGYKAGWQRVVADLINALTWIGGRLLKTAALMAIFFAVLLGSTRVSNWREKHLERELRARMGNAAYEQLKRDEIAAERPESEPDYKTEEDSIAR